jgi:hypothetical protein
MLADPWRQMSNDERSKSMARWNDVQEEWKKDPGIHFLCYYWTPGRSLDGFSHHWIFEVDDVSKVPEMNRPLAEGKIASFERYSFEVVWGNTENDDFWKS